MRCWPCVSSRQKSLAIYWLPRAAQRTTAMSGLKALKGFLQRRASSHSTVHRPHIEPREDSPVLAALALHSPHHSPPKHVPTTFGMLCASRLHSAALTITAERAQSLRMINNWTDLDSAPTSPVERSANSSAQVCSHRTLRWLQSEPSP